MSKHTRSGEIRDLNKRDRSDSLDRVFNATGAQNSPSGLNTLWETDNLLSGSAQASSIEQMHLLNQKKLRDGPGPNSYKQNDGDIFDAYFTGNDGSGTLDSDGMAGSLGFDDGLQFGSHSDIDGSFGGRGKGGLDGGFFAMDDLGGEQALSNSFKESMTFAKAEPEDSMPAFMSPPAQPQETTTSTPSRTSNKKKPAANSAAGALSGNVVPETKTPTKPASGNKASSAAAMLGSHPPSSAAMAAAMPPASAALTAPSIPDEGTERLSHKEVEQRRREKAKQYFDELRALLPCGADSKFDKNTILQNTIAMIKQLQAELENYRSGLKDGFCSCLMRICYPSIALRQWVDLKSSSSCSLLSIILSFK